VLQKKSATHADFTFQSHFVMQMASVVSLFLVGPRETQRKALQVFLEATGAESKQTDSRRSTIA